MTQVNNNTADFRQIDTLRNILQAADSHDVQDIINQLVVIKIEKSKEEEELSLSRLVIGSNRQEPVLVPTDLRHNKFRSPLPHNYLMEAVAEHFNYDNRRYRSARIKYRFVDLEGNQCEWSGQGRLPLKLRDLLAATGQSREDFLVQEALDSKTLLKLATKYYSPESSERLPLTESQQRLQNFTLQIEKELRAQEQAQAAKDKQDEHIATQADDTFDDQFCKY